MTNHCDLLRKKYSYKYGSDLMRLNNNLGKNISMKEFAENIHAGVAVFCGDTVLLVRQSVSLNTEFDRGKWGLPKGGVNLRMDESALDTGVRELKEEAGIESKYMEFVDYAIVISNAKQLYTFVCFLAFTREQLQPSILTDEICEARWVNIADVFDLPLNSCTDMSLRHIFANSLHKIPFV